MSETSREMAGRGLLKSCWKDLNLGASDQARGIKAPPQEKPCDEKGTLIDLVPISQLTIEGPSIAEAIMRRQSRRRYSPAALSLEELSFLLYATQGVRKRAAAYSFRTTPSGGARHPFETYLYTRRVEGTEEGLYRYLPLEHKLFLERTAVPGMAERLDAALCGQLWNAAAYFIWTAIPYRTEWRYAEAAAKLVAIDAGHLCENLYLACEAVGCGTCGIGAYLQEPLDEFLGVDGADEFAIYAAPVGKVE
jgi:SagB-type dehydrogenase family enzyme